MITLVGTWGGQGVPIGIVEKTSNLVTKFDSYVFVYIFFENSPETISGTISGHKSGSKSGMKSGTSN